MQLQNIDLQVKSSLIFITIFHLNFLFGVHWSHLHRHCTSPDLRFSRSGTTKLLARLTRSERLRMERRKASGIREKRCGVSGALVRSGKKKFFTANMMLRCNGKQAVALLLLLFWGIARVGNENKISCSFSLVFVFGFVNWYIFI